MEKTSDINYLMGLASKQSDIRLEIEKLNTQIKALKETLKRNEAVFYDYFKETGASHFQSKNLQIVFKKFKTPKVPGGEDLVKFKEHLKKTGHDALLAITSSDLKTYYKSAVDANGGEDVDLPGVEFSEYEKITYRKV